MNNGAEKETCACTYDCGCEDKQLLKALFQSGIGEQEQDSEQIRQDFDMLYEAMQDKNVAEMDEILDPVTLLCRDHEFEGFVRGVRVGIRLAKELGL